MISESQIISRFFYHGQTCRKPGDSSSLIMQKYGV
jgi:hypothetical protein